MDDFLMKLTLTYATESMLQDEDRQTEQVNSTKIKETLG
jgi:hypothetical protein